MNELFSEFRAISYKEWKNKANFDLGGKDFNKVLTQHNLEGIDTPPYTSSSSFTTKIKHYRNTGNGIKFGKTFYLKNEERSISILSTILKEEFELLTIHIPLGFELDKLTNVRDIFNRDLSLKFIRFSDEDLSTIIKWEKNNLITKKLFLNLDFIKHILLNGEWVISEKEDTTLFKKSGSISSDNIIPFGVDASIYHNSGANIIQQIAYSLAIAVEYSAIIGPDFFNKVQFNFAFGSNFFFEIAKIQVFDFLMNLVKTKYNIVCNNNISGESSFRNKTIYDAENNILRSTTEAFSAMLSGVNYFTNKAFDETFNAPNKFSSRIAYNQLLILREEAQIEKVINADEGSYYLDFIKGELSEKSLEIFKSIENGGGFLKQAKEGIIQRKISESAYKELDLIKKGEIKIVGLNSFKNEKEQISSKIRKYPFLKIKHKKTLIRTISEKRLSEYTEKKRLNLEKQQS